ncbi:nucleoside triphosphate pyrophosphatase [Candidatus Cyanaurora vandensis]|uniref:Maf family protein n=1 Tax=Candidatus Cyanaurora vandensis TaxID=2714958 RepID=UPI0025801DAC|nr:Maf family protein [Candidatus Cyanaurora vandensis]
MTVSLLLASASSRRRALLHQLNIEFRAFASQYAELMDNALPPTQLVLHNALGKALSLQVPYPVALILAADTVVVYEGQVLGKPFTAEKAIHRLHTLQGCWHTVLTGMVLVEGEQRLTRAQTTRVKLRPMDDDQIRAYVATGEPFDSAGGYSMAGLGAGLVETIEGCYTNALGLSLPVLVEMLLEFGQQVY